MKTMHGSGMLPADLRDLGPGNFQCESWGWVGSDWRRASPI